MAQHHCSAVGGLQCFLDIVIPIRYGPSWRYLVTDIPKALLSIPFTGMMRIACFHIEWVTSSVFFYKELLGSLPSGGRSWLGTSARLGGRMLHHIDDMFLVGLELETILCWTPEFSSLMTSDGRVCLQCRRLGFSSWVGENLLKGEATHSNILAWRIPWTEIIVHGVTKSWTQLSD